MKKSLNPENSSVLKIASENITTTYGEVFSGAVVEDYDLLLMAVPHYVEWQKSIGQSVAEHFKNMDIPEIQVLEIGFGTGITTKVLLDSDQRVKVIAIDNEQKVLSQAEEKLSEYVNAERVHFIVADALEHLKDTPSDSLDAVASAFVLHNFKKDIRQKIIEQIYRVLKPGGFFVNGDKYASDDEEVHKKEYETQVKRYDIFDTVGRKDLKNEWVAHAKEDEAPGVIFKEREAKETLKKIGFKNIQLTFRDTMEATISAEK